MSKIIGQLAEQKARKYLEKQHLVWVASNYQCPAGEIDLIMDHDEVLVFVEVRYRKYLDFGSNIETVERRKQLRLIKTAWHYLLQTNEMDKINCRFDVVGIDADEKIYWIQDAFEVKY